MRLGEGSAWTEDETLAFLDRFRVPLRVSANTPSGFPLICSLWFRRDGERLLCATQRSAHVARCLERDPRCAFELAPNEPPYFGVRGRGMARIRTEGAEAVLESLIDRYLDDRDSALARWLLARAADEVVIEIEPEWLTSWDYRDRMNP